MTKSYNIERGSLHDKFQNSRAKIQIFAGGFGNGKTTAAVVKALQLAKEYPGSNGLVARSTYPKLTNTIRKEFRAWCPKSWVSRDVDSKVNLMELKNGSVINFSHVQQTGKGQESSTSNLLSATYDWIVIDQVEDPEITEKDFLDLLGRLRGSTLYGGTDETMPQDGPRWFIMMCNPTRNWVYRKLVKPLHDLANGVKNPDLMLDDDGNLMVELFEGSTYENADNLPADFIKTQEAAYKGQMRSRFLMGDWGAYEGLVYPDYDMNTHLIDHDAMEWYYNSLIDQGFRPEIIEAYDHGIAKQSCGLFSFTTPSGDVCIMDGFYEKEQAIALSAREFKAIRRKYDYAHYLSEKESNSFRVYADPAIFRRASGGSKTVGTTTAGMFLECGIHMQRGNNDIINGIAKVQSYLFVDQYHRHPIHEDVVGAPRVFFSKKLTFIDTEITDYYWKKDTAGEYEDEPQDRNDHAMDTIKYLLTNKARVATFRANPALTAIPSAYRRWREINSPTTADNRKHRYA